MKNRYLNCQLSRCLSLSSSLCTWCTIHWLMPKMGVRTSREKRPDDSSAALQWKLRVWSPKTIKIGFCFVFFSSLLLPTWCSATWLGAKLTWQGLRGWQTGLLRCCGWGQSPTTQLSPPSTGFEGNGAEARRRRSRGPPSSLPGGLRVKRHSAPVLTVSGFSPSDTADGGFISGWSKCLLKNSQSTNGIWQKTTRDLQSRVVRCCLTQWIVGPHTYKCLKLVSF